MRVCNSQRIVSMSTCVSLLLCFTELTEGPGSPSPSLLPSLWHGQWTLGPASRT